MSAWAWTGRALVRLCEVALILLFAMLVALFVWVGATDETRTLADTLLGVGLFGGFLILLVVWMRFAARAMTETRMRVALVLPFVVLALALLPVARGGSAALLDRVTFGDEAVAEGAGEIASGFSIVIVALFARLVYRRVTAWSVRRLEPTPHFTSEGRYMLTLAFWYFGVTIPLAMAFGEAMGRLHDDAAKVAGLAAFGMMPVVALLVAAWHLSAHRGTDGTKDEPPGRMDRFGDSCALLLFGILSPLAGVFFLESAWRVLIDAGSREAIIDRVVQRFIGGGAVAGGAIMVAWMPILLSLFARAWWKRRGH